MGCVNSKENKSELEVSTTKNAAPVPANEQSGSEDDMKRGNGYTANISSGPLTQKEYNARVVTSNGPQFVTVPLQEGGSYTMKYAYVSQRGYYPESLDKANQDAFCVHTRYGGNPDEHFFGVFDGHGEFGTPCAQFAKDKVPENLLKDPRLKTDPEAAQTKTFVDTNLQLHRSHIDDSMSGTTGISCHIRGRTITVCNVGDSRAVMGTKNAKGRFTAVDLSSDQTPFRNDECARVKRAGARVLTLDQLEGLKDPNVQCWGDEEDDDGDPPRLWAPNGLYPGTAFTRSIGDAAAERIGVFAEPEILTKDLTSDCEYLVLASDGVFEFLPSQAVIDMIRQFEDTQEAALSVVAESYRLWLQYETRTDDITIIIIQLQGLKDAPASLPAEVPDAAKSNRPVRRAMSKAKRALIDTSNNEEEEEEWTLPTNTPKKSPEVLKMLGEAVKANFLFSHLNDEKRSLVFEAMTRRTVSNGDLIIQQGDKGDHFFVVEKGTFDVYVNHAGNKELGELVHTYQTTTEVKPSFGELALMYNKPRAASVKASSAGALWVLDRRAFKSILQKSDSHMLIRVLRSVEVLSALNVGQLQRMADKLQEQAFEDGEAIIKQGAVGNEFYIVQKGDVVCTVRKNPDNQKEVPKEVLKLGPNQYFGERALLANAKRAANVIAKGKVKCLYIGRETFEEVLGPLQHIINADRKWRERAAIQKETVARRPSVKIAMSINPNDIIVQDTLYTTETSQLCIAKHRVRGDFMTVKQFSLSIASELKKESGVMRERLLTKSLSPMPFIPASLKTTRDKQFLTVIVHSHALCTFDVLFNLKPFGTEAVKYYAASMALALEHLHMENIVFRGYFPENILIDEDGRLQLVDFHFSKQLDGKTFTLCGSPEYLAPEMIENTGHNQAADWWGLGVFIYFLYTGKTPFAEENDDDLKIYKRISAGQVNYPTTIPSAAKTLISEFLQPDPNQRLGYGPGGVAKLKAHPFFSGLPWDTLISPITDQFPIPAEVQSRVKTLQPSSVPSLEGVTEYNGPSGWYKDF